MSDPAPKRRATYQDVLDAPEHRVAEILNGELYLSPRPGGPATGVGSAIAGELYGPFDRGHGGPGGWVILFEPELHIAEHVIVPDLAGWRTERLPMLPEGASFTVVPDWVCEVLSPSTQRLDRIEKMPVYAAMGVQHLWLVHPTARVLEVFRLHEGNWLQIALHKDLVRARIEPFDAIELDLAAIWSRVPRPTRAGEEAAAYGY